MVPYIIIVLGAAISYIVSRQVHSAYKGSVTGIVLLLYLLFEAALVAFVLFASSASAIQGGGVVTPRDIILFLLVLWLPTIFIIGLLLIDYSGSAMTRALFYPPVGTPVRYRLGRMRTLLQEGKASSAVNWCLDEFDRNPKDFELLLDGAQLLEERGLFKEALKLLQEVIESFPDDMTAWSQAMWHAAAIRMDRLEQPDRARAMFRELAMKLPDKEVGIRARQRAFSTPPPEGPLADDPFYRERTDASEKEAADSEAPLPESPLADDPFYRKRQDASEEQSADSEAPTEEPLADDPFYRKRPETSEADAAGAEAPPPDESLQDEMPGAF